jgi:23S rRNA (cytidine1920-2'-O)/16S rRNA (cytidine1409-2'-O)-methyltransferase
VKDRLDKVMYEKGMVKSRERAKALIMEGRVFVEDRPVTKAGTMITPGARIEVRGEELPYVSRGGLKLEAALAHFGIDLTNKIVMDVGSSTGGFTDCMLQRGAGKVYCIDVGYGQLSWPLRKDPRVVLHERTNIRYLGKEKITEVIGFATIDVSFISLRQVLTKVAEFLKKGGEILSLVKPQFEVGKGEVGRGGIVREEGRRLAVVDAIKAFAEEKGLRSLGIFRSPIPGQKGNIEYFLFLRKE